MKHEIIQYTTHRLIKSEDLNHHGTLYAGRGAEWFVESGFIAAAQILSPHNIICLKIHGMTFIKSVKAGETICFNSRVVLAGKSSVKVYIKVVRENRNDIIFDGFITFVHVDMDGNPIPHNLEIEAISVEDRELQEIAKNFNPKKAK